MRWAVEAGFALPFRPGDHEDLSAKLSTLAENPGLRAELGRQGRQYASTLTWDHQGAAYEQYLLAVVEGAQ